jgi:hypothetical protein
MTKLSGLMAACFCLVVAGCGGDDDGEDRSAASRPIPELYSGGPGIKVAVPDADDSPPAGFLTLSSGGRELAHADEPVGPRPRPVRLDRPRLTGTMLGGDPESGAARVRVSVKELITCRLGSGRLIRREKVRYFPPPQIQRVRSSPGARIPVRARRSVAVRLGVGRCPRRAAASAGSGELWGEVTNGLGLEAVTAHIRFEWERRGTG